MLDIGSTFCITRLCVQMSLHYTSMCPDVGEFIAGAFLLLGMSTYQAGPPGQAWRGGSLHL